MPHGSRCWHSASSSGVASPSRSVHVHPLLGHEILAAQLPVGLRHEPLAEFVEAVPVDGEARRHPVAAEPLEEVAARGERVAQVEAGDAPPAALPDVGVSSSKAIMNAGRP